MHFVENGRHPLESLVSFPAWFIASPRRYIGLIIATVLSQWTLFRADLVFRGISGFATLDTQNDLTASSATEQIRSYTPRAIEAYELFAVIDYLFPLVASVLLSANLLWLVRLANRHTTWRLPPALALIGLLPFVFDYVENILLASSVVTAGSPSLVTAAIASKALKLLALGVVGITQFVALVYAIAMVIVRRRSLQKVHRSSEQARPGGTA